MSFQVVVLKANILGNLSRWDEFIVEVEKVEKILPSYEELDPLTQKKAKAKFFHLKGQLPFALANTEGIEWDIKSSFEYLKDALEINQQLDSKEDIIKNLRVLVLYYNEISSYEDALKHAKESQKTAEETENPYWIASTIGYLATVYYFKGDFSNSLYYSKRSLEIFEKLDCKGGILICKNSIGSIFMKTGKLENAKELFLEVISEVPEILSSLVNIAMVLTEEGKLIEALEYLEEADELFQKKKYLIQYPAFHISRIKILQGYLDEALIFLKQFLQFAEKRKFIIGTSYSLALIASVYWQKGMNQEAIEFAFRALEAIRGTNNKQWEAVRLSTIIQLLIGDNQLDKAKEYFEQFQILCEDLDVIKMKQYVRFIEALFLKSSENMRDKLKSEFVLEQLLKEDMPYYLRLQSTLNLCEIYIFEFQQNGDKLLLEKIKINIGKLDELANKTQSFTLIVQTLQLQAKIAIIDLDFSEAKELMSEALLKAEERGLKGLELILLKEKENLARQSISLEKLEVSQIESFKTTEIAKLGEDIKILQRDSFSEIKQDDSSSLGKLVSINLELKSDL